MMKVEAKNLEEGMKLRLGLKKDAKITCVQVIDVPIHKVHKTAVISFQTKDGADYSVSLNGDEEVEIIPPTLTQALRKWWGERKSSSSKKRKKDTILIRSSGDIAKNMPAFLFRSK